MAECLFVCVLDCWQHYANTTGQIFMKKIKHWFTFFFLHLTESLFTPKRKFRSVKFYLKVFHYVVKSRAVNEYSSLDRRVDLG